MWARVGFLLVFGMVLAGCPRQPGQSDERVLVVTTLPDLADWVRNVAGERVVVRNLLTGGEEPHSYEPKPQDAELISRARLLVRVGLGLDDWLDGLVENSRSQQLHVITVGEEIDLIQDADKDGHAGHAHSKGNPHVWLDPAVAKATVGLIVAQLCRVFPAGEREFTERAARYTAELDSVTDELVRLSAGLANRRFVSFHETWPYFCRRFGFEAVAAVEPQPGQEPSVRWLSELAARMRAESISVIVVEPQHNRDVAEALARETNSRVVVLGSLVGSLREAGSYLQLIDFNVRTLAAALGR